jgi:sterol desaturase/sphingolipid hydroxylase (fatty acid hydroxylase superfamily)
MTAFLTTYEPIIRLGAFLAVAVAMAGAEAWMPRRARARGRGRRWPVNIALATVDTVLVRLVFPAAVVAGIAAWAATRGIGLFNALPVPQGLAIVLSVVLLDLMIYGQHLAFHFWKPLWRLHRVHHCDLDVDFTTALRFHPVEILLSVVIKGVAVVAVGAPVAAVIVFEILLNGSAMFNHGNIRLPARVDRLLRAVVVTPDMHRVHHSILRHETDSNFGFALSLWDRLFRTYRDQPALGHDAMTIGLPEFRDDADQGLVALLLNPARGKASGSRH